jgi:hypothetical protein
MKFNLNDYVYIAVSMHEGVAKECGEIVARAEYTTSDPNYLVRYVGADGMATEQWWTESALRAL